MSKKLLVIGDAPSDSEQLLNDNFLERDGLNIKRLLKKVNINNVIYHNPTSIIDVREKIKESNVVLCLNRLIASNLLDIKINKVKNGIYQTNPELWVWYNTNYIYMRGKNLENETIDFFKKLESYLND